MIKFNIQKISKIFLTIVFFFILATIILLKIKSFNYGIDFIGGSVLECEKFSDNTSVKSIFKKYNIPYFQEDLTKVTRIKVSGATSNEIFNMMVDDIKKYTEIKIIKTSTIAPSLSTELYKKAIYALLFSFIAIFGYVALIFGTSFGFIAVFGIGLNIYFLVNIILLLEYEVNFSSITALLIILGYSINDTMVIYDRIRSNAKNKILNIFQNINRSLDSVLKRSIITSLLTLISSFCLTMINEYSIFQFAIIVCFGIIIGTFFSIILVPSLLALFKVNLEIFLPKEKDPAFYNS